MSHGSPSFERSTYAISAKTNWNHLKHLSSTNLTRKETACYTTQVHEHRKSYTKCVLALAQFQFYNETPNSPAVGLPFGFISGSDINSCAASFAHGLCLTTLRLLRLRVIAWFTCFCSTIGSCPRTNQVRVAFVNCHRGCHRFGPSAWSVTPPI